MLNSSNGLIHLLSTFCRYGSAALKSRSRARESVKRFLMRLYTTCHAQFSRTVRFCHDKGVQMIIPGLGIRTVRMYLAALCGDKPALYAMAGLKTGNCHRGCHICCFDIRRNCDPYDPNVHIIRDFDLLLECQKTCVDYLEAEEAGSDTSTLGQRYEAASNFCDYYGALPMVTPFTTAALGWGRPSAIFNSTVRDIFHDLEAGLFPSIIMMILRIVNAIARNDSQYSNAISVLDEFTSARRVMRHPPRYKKMDHTTFHEGCASMLLNTATGQANAGSTGTTAGMRSSWSKVMMMALHVAIGTSDGQILPNRKFYALNRKIRLAKLKSQRGHDPKSHVKGKKKTVKSTVYLKNPAKMCARTLAIALDVYAEFNRSVWTTDLVIQVEKKVRELQSCVTVLHHVMVACCRVTCDIEDYQVRY
jgi:hypothetical protein